ncbi:MAG: hypothetical protein R6T91_03120, partial [Bacteroidales bacterium]
TISRIRYDLLRAKNSCSVIIITGNFIDFGYEDTYATLKTSSEAYQHLLQMIKLPGMRIKMYISITITKILLAILLMEQIL